MTFDLVLDPRDEPEQAAVAERAGFGAGWVTETVRDPFLYLCAAAPAAPRLQLGTAVAVAFARSPMVTATCAWDVQRRTGGRFLLGLGTQVRPHVERRFSMPWSRPVERMREYVLALRAIWAAWAGRGPLAFHGDFYTHDLMTDFFSPGPLGCADPPVLLAGVGARMTALAGEVADGFVCGPLTSERTFAEHTWPALRQGLARRAAPTAGFRVCVMPLVVTGHDAASTDRVRQATRARLAFYAATPAYGHLLARHGWDEVHERLRMLARSGRIADMADLIDEEILDAFAIVAPPGRVAAEVRRRFGGAAGRVLLGSAAALDPGVWQAVMAGAATLAREGAG